MRTNVDRRRRLGRLGRLGDPSRSLATDPRRVAAMAPFHLGAGSVTTISRTISGTYRADDLIFRGAIPDACATSIRDLTGFANSL